jgi:hypothetical protein
MDSFFELQCRGFQCNTFIGGLVLALEG